MRVVLASQREELKVEFSNLDWVGDTGADEGGQSRGSQDRLFVPDGLFTHINAIIVTTGLLAITKIGCPGCERSISSYIV